MNSQTNASAASAASKRSMGVVAVALLEKFQKLNLIRKNMQREQVAMKVAAAKLNQRMEEVESELAELAEALKDYDVNDVEKAVENEDARWTREQKRYSQAEGRIPVPDLYPESRQQKQAVITEVRDMLEGFGSMHVRDIHKVLRADGFEVPSLSRLSQILSESDEFQADRSTGWSLKGERPSLRQPGLSGSTTTSSGDESLKDGREHG